MTVTWDSSRIDAKLRAAVTRAVATAAEAVATEGTRLILSPPKTGRIYMRRGVKHQASAPGESPANDTGALAGSVRVIWPEQLDFFHITATVNWSTIYARRLELGDERVAARPYARPALDHSSAVILQAMRGTVRTGSL